MQTSINNSVLPAECSLHSIADETAAELVLECKGTDVQVICGLDFSPQLLAPNGLPLQVVRLPAAGMTEVKSRRPPVALGSRPDGCEEQDTASSSGAEEAGGVGLWQVAICWSCLLKQWGSQLQQGDRCLCLLHYHKRQWDNRQSSSPEVLQQCTAWCGCMS